MKPKGYLVRVRDALEDALTSSLTPPMRWPRVVQFPVNDICNSRCQMCHIWQRSPDFMLFPEQLRTVLSSRLYRRVEWIGMNGGEPTLRRDLADLAATAIEVLPRLRGLSVITNALSASRVTTSLSRLGAVCGAAGVHLDVMVSLDGLGEVHDRVRGVSGNFVSAVKVLDYLQGSSEVGSVRVGYTVVHGNVFGLERFLQWCRDRDIYARFRLGVPHRRLGTEHASTPFALDSDEVFHFAVFLDQLVRDYEPDFNRQLFYRSLRDQLVYGASRVAGCLWKSCGVTLSSRGTLSFCSVASEDIGNALVEDSTGLYWGARAHLRSIVRERCPSCRHDLDGPADRPKAVRRLVRVLAEPVPGVVRRPLAKVRDVLRRSRADTHSRRLQAALSAAAGVRHTPCRPGPSRLLVCGWYGTETQGDKAILAGILGELDAVAGRGVSFDVASIEPYITERTLVELGIENRGRVLSIATAREALERGEYSAVVLGGGPMMSAIGECVEMLELFVAGRGAGARTVVLGCGVGPLTGGPNDRVIRALLDLSTHIVVRDSDSARRVSDDLGHHGPVEVSHDPAFLWAADTCDAQSFVRDPKVIALALRDWPLHEYSPSQSPESGEEIKAAFEEQLRAFVEVLWEFRPELELLPVCMHRLSAGGDDRAFYRRVFGRYPRILGELDDRHSTPERELRLLATASVAVTMRYHALVFALSARTPVIAIDYTSGGKVASLAGETGLEPPAIPLGRVTARELAARILGGVREPQEIAERVSRTRSSVRSALRHALWMEDRHAAVSEARRP